MIRALVISLALTVHIVPALAQADQHPPGAELEREDRARIGTLNWIRGQITGTVNWRDLGQLAIAPGGVVAADLLVLAPEESHEQIDVPAGEARFLLVTEPAYGRVNRSSAREALLTRFSLQSA